jgi:hypothetical protein
MPNGDAQQLTPHKTLSKPELFAHHYFQLKNVKEAARLAGYSDSYIKGQLHHDKKDPDSALLRALRQYIETQGTFRTAKADSITDDFLDACGDVATHMRELPSVDDKIKLLPKVANAMEFARKNGSKGQDIQHQTITMTSYQVFVGQLAGKSVSRQQDNDTVIEGEYDDVSQDSRQG